MHTGAPTSPPSSFPAAFGPARILARDKSVCPCKLHWPA